MKTLRAGIGAIVLLGALLASGRAEAADCSFSTTSVVFGTYNVFTATPLDSTGSVIINCSQGRSITVQVSAGSSGSFGQRQMKNGAQTLNYNIYKDAACTSIFGDGTSGTSNYTNSSTPSGGITITLYGRIPAQQDVSAGAYSDTLVVTVIY